jgi:ParB-like chromosome segregation protein Spo0J
MNVSLSKLIPHPHACSHQTGSLKEKLKAHIQATKLYPPIVVRSLSKSKEFYCTNGKLQIIDGHLRYEILKELGLTSINVVNFGPLSDEQTMVLLLTLNQLRAHDNPQKRAKLIHACTQRRNLPLEQLEKLLPDTKRSLERLYRLATQTPRIHSAPKKQAELRPLALYLDPDQHRLVQSAVSAAKKQFKLKNLADALETIARDFLRGGRDSQSLATEITNPSAGLSAGE